MHRRSVPVLFLLPFLLSACGANLRGSTTMDDLQDQPAQTTTVVFHEGDSLALPGFSVAGKVMNRNGELIVVYEYNSETASAADAAKVSTDGRSVDGNALAWNGPVHFFRHGRVTVVYVGTNADLLATLRADAGDQFAGE